MKHLKLFFALFAMLALGVGNAWAESETVTFTNKDWAPWTKITSGSSFESASPSRGVANNGVNGSCKSSKSYSNITKISYVASSNTTGGKVTIKVGETKVGETSIPKENNKTFEYTVDNLSGVITLSVTKPSSKTVYVKSITIETASATPDPVDPTVTFSNGNYTVGGTLNLSTLWTSNSDGAVTYTVKTDGGTGATINGTSFTATAAGTCEIKASQAATSAYNAIEKTATITVTAPTPATITLSEAGVETSVSGKNVGDSYTLPTTSSQTCGDKTFVGWSTVEISTPGDKPTSNFYEPGTTVTLAAEQTFYAVYATEGEGGGNVFDGTAGGTFKIYAIVSGQNYYAKGTGQKISSTTNEGEATEYTFTKVSDGVFSIKTSTTYITYASSSNLGTNNTTAYNWKISAGTNGTWRIASVATNTRGIIFRAKTYNQFGGYALSNATEGSTEYFDVEIGGGSAASYSDYTTTCSGSTEPVYSVTLNQPATGGTIEADKDEAVAGATVTLTATPDAGYKFSAWDVKDANNAVVTVSADGKFTMPESAVTVTASFVAKTQYTIKWNVAEGSVADTKVYEGEALGSLPTAPNCSAGKVFIGWTEATSVNADGSDLVLAKETDVPTENKEYNAVYATLGAASDKIDELDLSLTDASGSTYSSWSGKESVSDAVYAGNSAGGNSSIQLRHDTEKAASGVITTTSGGKATKVAVTWHSSTTNGRTLNVYGNNTPYSTVKDLWDGEANQGTLLGTIVYGTSTELQIEGDYKYIGLRSKSGAMYLSQIDITWSATSASDYSLNCEVNNTPFLTVAETPINFGTVAQNETVTETLSVSGGYLAEDVALTISGTNASFFSVSPETITKAEEVDQDVTITYNPTATGDHTATLTIKSGEITKTVALSGTVLAPGKWALVTDASQLNLGDEIIIVAADANVALSTTQNTNNRGQAEIVKVGNTVNAGGDVQILTLGQGTVENTYAFSTGSGYLYAAGTNSSNHLKTKTALDATGSWAITIDNATGVATIKAQDSNTKRNWLRYNATNNPPIFSCYESGQNDVCVYRNTDVIAAPIISGNVDFTTETLVTITAQNGLTVYYTTNGSTPDKTATQYSAPFTISATTTVKAIAYDATDNASAVAEMTFTKHDLVNVATAMALPVDEIAYLSQFEVVYPLKDKSFIYIKDNSGYGLIYDGTLDEQFKAGDRVEGFIGTSSPYKSLPELKAVNKYEDLTITSGVAAEPIEFAAEPTVADVNKYVVFKNVQFDAAVTFETTNATNATFTIGSETVTLRNNYKYAASLDANKAYDVYGFVATFQQNEGDPVQVQVYFLTAVEAGGVIETYTVTYDANGATGAAPVDETKYQAGQTFYIENQGELVKEGYEFVGWKYNGTVYEAGKQFTMPTENVTFVAQWEEIVVTPRQDFSAGLWVLVTDVSELADEDYIIVAAADLDVAMKSYELGNYCTHMTITKYGSTFLQWDENIGVFQLAKNDDNYTIQDVNTKQYLYAAGSGSNNYLKAATEIPTDADEVKKYIWTITIEEGITTVKATSENRNTLKYNKNSGQERFSCYASGQQDIVLYKYTTDFYTRDVTKNQYGTICLDKGGVPVSGATFYEVAYKNTQTKRVLVDEVVRLKAGVPYVFLPNATQIKIALDGTTAIKAQKANGLQGTFDEIQDGDAGAAGNILEGNHMLYNNSILKCGGNCTLPAYRAYFIVDDISTEEKASAPGRQRVALGYQGENAATGLDNITESGVIAPAMQGTYDILGRQLSEPTATGFYIVNGKKVFVVK